MSHRGGRRGARPEVVLRCGTGAHRVRLDPDRFWRSARCPRCRSRVDRTRARRAAAYLGGRLPAPLRRWLGSRYRGSGRSQGARMTWLAAWLYVVAALLVWAVLWGLGDRWWPATVLLFGPRWMLLLPGVALLLAAVRWRPRSLVPVLGATLVLIGPVMGFRPGISGWFAGGTQLGDLRVMSFNARGGQGMTRSSLSELLTLRPDIVAVQECRGIANLREALPDWHHHQLGPQCVSTRFRILEVDTLPRGGVAEAGGSGWGLRYVIATPTARLTLANLHLDTPRQGLAAVRRGQLLRAIRDLRWKSELREIESRRARRWLEQVDGPLLVAGDFNLPVESVIYRRYWGDFTNAFSVAGRGFGATRLNGWIRVRIDHVLLGAGWRTVRAFTGPDVGSDHLPMIADLRWVGRD